MARFSIKETECSHPGVPLMHHKPQGPEDKQTNKPGFTANASGKQRGGSLKSPTYHVFWPFRVPAFPYLREKITRVPTKTFTCVSIAALFVIA